MNIKQLIINHIRFTKYIKAYSSPNSDEIEIKFLMSVPMWIDDKEVVKDPFHTMLYAGNRKKNINQFEAKFEDLSKGYPQVGNNKFFTITRNYKILDLLKDDKDIIYYLKQERTNAFREVKSNIMLQKIGYLTKEWDELTSGKESYLEKVKYSDTKFDRNYNKKVKEDYPF